MHTIGVEPDQLDSAPHADRQGENTQAAETGSAAAGNPTTLAIAPRERKTRDDTKQALIIRMLRRPEGASIAEIAAATGWLSHTILGAIAGALKKKLGLVIDSEKDDKKCRVYRLANRPLGKWVSHQRERLAALSLAEGL